MGMTTLIPDTLPDDIAISERHRQILASSAILIEVAVEAGVRTISSAEELPTELEWCSGRLPGLLFCHRRFGRPDDALVPQYRPDNPGEGPKYLFPSGSGSVLSVHPRMERVVAAAKKAVIVEGTKQYLAVVSYAPSDVLIVGIQGCQSWSSDGVPVPELDQVASSSDGGSREVTILFDADLGVNRDVYDAAKRLCEHLKLVGASTVNFARVPAGGTAGIDDWLGGRAPEQRSAALARLLEQATDKLPRPPAKRPVTIVRTGEFVEPIIDDIRGVVQAPDQDTPLG
jgi:hypothetical protein